MKIVALSDEDKELLPHYWTEKVVEKNEYLLTNGTICKYDSFVCSGSFKAFFINPKTGKEEIIFFAVENWWATDISSFSSQIPSIYFIQALERSVVLQIDKHSFGEMLIKISSLEKFFRIILESYIGSLQKRIIYEHSVDAKSRYFNFLRDYPEICEKVPQYLIASYLGVTPEFISRLKRA